MISKLFLSCDEAFLNIHAIKVSTCKGVPKATCHSWKKQGLEVAYLMSCPPTLYPMCVCVLRRVTLAHGSLAQNNRLSHANWLYLARHCGLCLFCQMDSAAQASQLGSTHL